MVEPAGLFEENTKKGSCESWFVSARIGYSDFMAFPSAACADAFSGPVHVVTLTWRGRELAC